MPKHAATHQPKTLDRSHDTRQPINRAPSPQWVKNFREQIKVKALLTRLQTFALDDPDEPTSTRMTRTQAQVALSLLRKVLPDMQAIEISGQDGAPIQVQILRFSDDMDSNADRAMVIDAAPTPANPLQLLGRVESMPNLIEDEPQPPRRRFTRRGEQEHESATSQRRTRRRKPNQ